MAQLVIDFKWWLFILLQNLNCAQTFSNCVRSVGRSHDRSEVMWHFSRWRREIFWTFDQYIWFKLAVFWPKTVREYIFKVYFPLAIGEHIITFLPTPQYPKRSIKWSQCDVFGNFIDRNFTNKLCGKLLMLAKIADWIGKMMFKQR